MPEPGGFIQWGEPDFQTRRIIKTRPENSSEALEKLFAAMTAEDRRLQPTWVAELEGLFRSQGLVDIAQNQRTGPPHLSFALNECNTMVYDEILDAGMIAEDKKAGLRHLLSQASKECRNGVANICDRVHVIGRKPPTEP